MTKKFLLAIVFMFSSEMSSFSQQSKHFPLKIGDAISEALWDTSLQVVNTPNGKKTITLKDYKSRLIILDFWATHCVPCIRSLYKLDTLQQQFKEKVLILPVSNEKKEIIKSFIFKRGWRLPSVVDDIVLQTYFPHLIVPHQVWISNGKILAITSGEEATIDHIQKVLGNEDITLYHKSDIAFNPKEPITKYLNQARSKANVHSILTGYIDGLGGTGTILADSVRISYFLNRSTLSIYREVFNLNNNKIKVEVGNADDLANKNNDKHFLFCYQLFMPANKGDVMHRAKMEADLNDYFGLTSRFEKRDLDCYVITNQSDSSISMSSNKVPVLGKNNLPFSQFIDELNYSSKWIPDQPIFVGEIKQNVAIDEVTPAEIATLRKDMNGLVRFLANRGLTIRKEVRQIKVLVISQKL